MTTQTLAQRILDELIRQDSGFVGNASDDISIVIIDGSFDLQQLATALIGDQEPYGYVVEERKPSRFTFQKKHPSISDEDMNEGEITIDPVYIYPAEPIKIKQLEWRTFCATSGNCSAKAFGDEYVVQNEGDRWNMYLPHQDQWCSIHPTLDEAKAAAQSNFEVRIREALL